MALLDNNPGKNRQLVLNDGVLRTNGALASIKVPLDWTASIYSKFNHPDYPDRTSITLSKRDSRITIGIFFSGRVLDADDARSRKRILFDNDVTMRASSIEAREPSAISGPMSQISKLEDMLLEAAPHPVQSDEKFCIGIKSTNFNKFKAVMFEFENPDIDSKTIEYCLDIFGDGRVVYILYYCAPIEAFAKHMDLAAAIFNTSVWRTDFDPMITLDVVN